MPRRYVIQAQAIAIVASLAVPVTAAALPGKAPGWAIASLIGMALVPALPLSALLWLWSRIPLPDNSGILSVSPADSNAYQLAHEVAGRHATRSTPLTTVEGALLLDGAATNRLMVAAVLDLAYRAGCRFSLGSPGPTRTDLWVDFNRAAIESVATHPWELALLPLLPESRVPVRELPALLQASEHWKPAALQFSQQTVRSLSDRGLIHIWPVYLYVIAGLVWAVGVAMMLTIFSPPVLILNWWIHRKFERAGSTTLRSRHGRQVAAIWSEYRRWLETGTRLDDASLISFPLWEGLLVDAVALGVADRFLDEAGLDDRLAHRWTSRHSVAQYNDEIEGQVGWDRMNKSD